MTRIRIDPIRNRLLCFFETFNNTVTIRITTTSSPPVLTEMGALFDPTINQFSLHIQDTSFLGQYHRTVLALPDTLYVLRGLSDAICSSCTGANLTLQVCYACPLKYKLLNRSLTDVCPFYTTLTKNVCVDNNLVLGNFSREYPSSKGKEDPPLLPVNPYFYFNTRHPGRLPIHVHERLRLDNHPE